MDSIKDLTDRIIEFRDERDWKKFHNAKDLALAISIEAAELNEIFLWRTDLEGDSKKIREELADVFMYALLLAHQQGLDVRDIILDKLNVNGTKYPVDKSRGSATKYDQL